MGGSSGNSFGRLSKKDSQPEPKQEPGAATKPTPKNDLQPGAPYKKGDVIGQNYEVYGVLGKGGFGVVYLVYSHENGGVYALKTFRDEFLADQEVRKRFHKEASVWEELGFHPYLVRANAVEKMAGRLYIAMEFIAPNEEGLNSLEGYLQRRPPDLAQSLRWAIQVCHGMEYATSKGVHAHRDLKPANIMISQDKTARITDFGLAGVVSELPVMRASGLGAQPGRIGPSGQTMPGAGFGTPTHMAPEQFDNAAGCDERSDIYSFGIVLYQMAAGGRLPFPVPIGADWQGMRQLHRESPVPRLDSPLFPVIQRCLEKARGKRYQSFKDVRKDLEPLLQHQTGEVIIPPQLKELEAPEWGNKGVSLNSLSRYEEAIQCFDKSLELDPRFGAAWNNKGNSLGSLGRHEEAIHCYDKALELDPCHAVAWNNKGVSLSSLGRHEEAIRCYDQALELDPRYVDAWNNKGNRLDSLSRHEEALRCYDQALELDPRYVNAWYNKGNSLASQSRHEAAIHCYDQALSLDPSHVGTWFNKSNSLASLGHHEEAIRCYDQALELDPRDIGVWTNKGNGFYSLGRYEEAIRCFDNALELDPRFVAAWTNKGNSLNSLSRHEEAIRCFEKALELDPHDKSTWNNKGYSLRKLGRYGEAINCYEKALKFDPRYADAWYNKALAEDELSHFKEAVHSYQQFMALAPEQYANQKEYAFKRLWKLCYK